MKKIAILFTAFTLLAFSGFIVSSGIEALSSQLFSRITVFFFGSFYILIGLAILCAALFIFCCLFIGTSADEEDSDGRSPL